jgi:dipeptidyl aminopeptidase/acylaminoacyl peptidase
MPRPLKPEDLIRSGTITGLDVSPDGQQIVFGSTLSGVSQIYLVPIDGGEPRQITQSSEASTIPKWSPRGDLIAYLQDIGGDENYQIYVVHPSGGEPDDVTGAPGYLHENYAWSWDGSRVTYVSNRDGQFDVYYSDVPGGRVHRVTNHPAVHHSPQFSPEGTRIAFSSNRTQYRSNWDTFVVSLDTREERQITRHDGEADEMSYYANQLPLWSPDGRRILMASSVRGNYDVFAIDVDSLEREVMADSGWDEGNAQWSPEGSHVAYVCNEDGNDVLYVKDLASGRAWPVSQQEGVSGAIGMRGKGGDYRWTPDSRHLVYSHSGPTEAGSIWIAAREGGEPRCLYSTLPGEIDRGDLVRPSLVHYPSFDGLQISAFLYRPQDAQGAGPAIVLPHGGPTGQTMNSFDPMVQYLVSRGYTVIAPNFRGSTGYGRDFQWMNKNDWGGGDLNDLVAAADWLREQGIAGPVGITGGSYGGYMTMNAVTKYPDRWDAAVAIFPMVDLETSYAGARPDMRQFQERNIGTPQENPQLYHERSPINFVEHIRCPVLILQGDRDARCRLSEVESMVRRADQSGVRLELVVYPHEGHGFAQLEHRLDSLLRTADFFDRHLAKIPAGA